MILSPFRRIERFSFPIASHLVLTTAGFLYGDRSKPLGDCPIAVASPMHFSCDAVDISGDRDLFFEKSAEIGIGAEGGDLMRVSETRTSLVEDFADRHATESDAPHPGGRGNTDHWEYRDVFGPDGSIKQCKEQFIESRFSPRKPVRLSRREVRVQDFGRKIHEPTDVCVVAVSLVSHAA